MQTPCSMSLLMLCFWAQTSPSRLFPLHYASTTPCNLCMPGEYRQYIHSFAVVAERILRLLRHEKTDIGGKKPTTPPLLLYLIWMPYLNALFFRMITTAPQNHLTQENAICDPKHTPAYSKNARPPPKKTPSLTPKAPITATKHQRILPPSDVHPKTPDMWAKKHRPTDKTKHMFYQNTTTSSITYDFFHRNTLFSACITEKCNTEYSTEHKIQGEQTRIKRTDPYTALIASAPFPMRPRKKKRNTHMPDRYARPE